MRVAGEAACCGGPGEGSAEDRNTGDVRFPEYSIEVERYFVPDF